MCNMRLLSATTMTADSALLTGYNTIRQDSQLSLPVFFAARNANRNLAKKDHANFHANRREMSVPGQKFIGNSHHGGYRPMLYIFGKLSSSQCYAQF